MLTSLNYYQKMSSLSRNSCAKAFGNWSRGKNFRPKKPRDVQRPPPPASLGVKNNKPRQKLLVLIKRNLVVSDSYVIVRGGSRKSGTKGLLEGGSIYAQKNVFLILSTRRNAEGVGALSTTPVNLPLPVVVR